MRERKIIRLRDFDYRSHAVYAVTICAFRKRCVFGRCAGGRMHLNRFGIVTHRFFEEIPLHFPSVAVDEFIVMPNHLHGILVFHDCEDFSREERRFGKPQSGSLGATVGAFKSAVTKEIDLMRGEITKVWQPRFYDHIVRHEKDWEHQREYIRNNSIRWSQDELDSDAS